MAHPTIDARREYVKKLLDQGVKFDQKLKATVGQMFGSSPSAIHADIIHFSTLGVEKTIHVSKMMRKRVLARDGRECQYCRTVDPSREYIVEHIIPAAWGGVAKPYNLVIACQNCNKTKGRSVWVPCNLDAITKDNPEWRQRILTMASQTK